MADKATSGRIEAKTPYSALKVPNARGKVPSLKADKGTWAKLTPPPESTAEQAVRDSKPAPETLRPPKGPIRMEAEPGNKSQCSSPATPAALKPSDHATVDSPCGACRSASTKSASPREHAVGDPNHAVVLAWAQGIDKKRRATEPKRLFPTQGGQQNKKPASSAEQRNIKRWRAADDVDIEILGELTEREKIASLLPWLRENGLYDKQKPVDLGATKLKEGAGPHLSHDANDFFPEVLMGPDDSHATPDWFIPAVEKLLATETKTPVKSPIIFEVNRTAAKHNARLLEGYGFDLARFIGDNLDSTLGYGSEFRGVEELEPLLWRHPNFPALKKLIKDGMDYVFARDINEETKTLELETLIERGNHKSANDELARVEALLAKDVVHGFSIPLPAELVRKLPGAAVQPLGIVAQWTVRPNGTREIKHRLTQDLSFSSNKSGPERSINSRVDMTAYAEMVYGWCLPRIFHIITSLRTHHPDLNILISKYDYSDAYRRVAHAARAAMQTIAIVGGIAYLSLRLTFGGCPNPPAWCLFSETVTDLANELAKCMTWDPTTTFSPAQATVPSPVRLPQDIAREKARPMAVLSPVTSEGVIDDFIDDLISVFLDTPENVARYTQAVPLAMELTSRPYAGDDREPIPRRPILSQSKLQAEGSPAEVQIVLGWEIDTRRMQVSLPDDKYKAWSSDLIGLRRRENCPRGEIESLIGRLNHTSLVLPDSRHFLGRIRAALGPHQKRRHTVRLGPEVHEDLALWEEFLLSANQGVPLSLLVTRTPDRICWSDACPMGIGGYSLSGRAWRVRIPSSSVIYGSRKINNLLEFMGMVINVWLTCLEPASDQSCVLAVGDNTSAIGWLHSTSRLDPTWGAHNAHLLVARKLARLLMEHRCCLASQHIKGELNLVADWLSFSGSGRGKHHPLAFDDPPDDILTARFHALIPSQIPANFEISRLPSEILCWTTRVLQIAASYLMDEGKGATKATTGPGGDGSGSVPPSDTPVTPSSLLYPQSSKSSSEGRSSASVELPPGTPMADLKELVRSQWSQVLCAKPQATWHQRSGVVSGRVPCTSRELRTCDPPSVPSSRHAKT